MKRVYAIALALWTMTASAAVLDIKVYDAFGQSYRTTNIGESLGAIYNISFDPTLVLILGPALNDERVKQQERIVAELDPEQYGILFAIGTPTQAYSRGFSVTPNQAGKLLAADNAFRTIVLGPDGTVLADSSQVIPRDRLLALAPGGV